MKCTNTAAGGTLKICYTTIPYMYSFDKLEALGMLLPVELQGVADAFVFGAGQRGRDPKKDVVLEVKQRLVLEHLLHRVDRLATVSDCASVC